MKMFVRSARAALVFMTRIPVGGFPYSPEEWRWAPAHFPFAGAVVGCAGALVAWAAHPLGSFLAATLATASTVWLTGAFHEDGLADTADALGGAHGPKKLLEILKDSRIGTYGAAALAFSLLLRVGALDALAQRALGFFFWVHVVARTFPVWIMAALPYVSEPGSKGSAVARGAALPQALSASGWLVAGACVAVALGQSPLLLLLQVLLSGAISLWLARWFRVRALGFTGDFLGAAEQALEVVLWLSVVAWLGAA